MCKPFAKIWRVLLRYTNLLSIKSPKIVFFESEIDPKQRIEITFIHDFLIRLLGYL